MIMIKETSEDKLRPRIARSLTCPYTHHREAKATKVSREVVG
jgi:hypothetical protein